MKPTAKQKPPPPPPGQQPSLWTEYWSVPLIGCLTIYGMTDWLARRNQKFTERVPAQVILFQQLLNMLGRGTTCTGFLAKNPL